MKQINKRIWLSPIIKKSDMAGFQPCFPPLPQHIRFSRAEKMPPWLFYLPGAIWWFCLSLYYRSFTLPCLVNPTIFMGGMANETKTSIFEQIDKTPLKEHLPLYRTLHNQNLTEEQLKQAIQEMGIDFPMIAKPDISCKGLGIKLVDNMACLLDYVRDYPKGEKFLLCEFIDYPEEIGIFYVRFPETNQVILPSLTLKYPFLLSGDGKKTIHQLLRENDGSRRLLPLCKKRYGEKLEEILPEDCYFRATAMGSHTLGSIFRDGEDLIDDALFAQVKKLAEGLPDFYYGRFDIRCRSLDDFKKGKNFKIMELNCASAEMTHIWDPDGSLWRAWAGIFLQVSLLFKVGAQVKKHRHYTTQPVSSFAALWSEYRAELKRYKSYPIPS